MRVVGDEGLNENQVTALFCWDEEESGMIVAHEKVDYCDAVTRVAQEAQGKREYCVNCQRELVYRPWFEW